jgi:hypothetical protein
VPVCCVVWQPQACKTLSVKKTVGRGDELVLESVLAEGSYGKALMLNPHVVCFVVW